jgi:uncharacterized protein (TIRG00374 family)
MNKLLRKLLIGLVVGVGLYAAATIYVGVDAISASLASFAGWRMLPVLGLTLANYFIRYLKWALYLRILKFEVPRAENVTIFLSGLSMVVTPGKVGELLKSYLLKTARGVPMARSAPVVLAERLTDLIALLLLMSIGLFAFRRGALTAVIMGGVVVSFLVVIGSRRLSLPLLGLAVKLPVLRRHGDKLDAFYDATATLLRPVPLIAASGLSVASWFCECAGTYLVVSGFADGVGVTLFLATFIYSATTVGGLPTPGGLGLTDGGMAAMLRFQGGVSKGTAAAATMLVRLATLWFAVVVGVLALLVFRKRVGLADDVTEQLKSEHPAE